MIGCIHFKTHMLCISLKIVKKKIGEYLFISNSENTNIDLI